MRIRLFAIAALWSLSLVGVAVWAQGRSSGRVISGADIGFQPSTDRLSGDQTKITGRWVVRIDGVWHETTAPISVQPAR
jgi:hypothetical protein